MLRPLVALVGPVLGAAALAAPTEAQLLEIHTLSVGSGDCALVISPTGTTMLIDTGRPGAGTTTVVPYMQSLGITDLDYVVISHYDGDHIGGLPELLAAGYTPTAIYDRGDFEAEQHPIFLDYVAAAGALRTQITTGMTLDLGGGAVMQHWIQNGDIWNGPNVNVNGKVENAKSSGWVLSYGNFDYGTFGDIAVFLEDQLAPLVGDLDVYKASHHGSSTSSGTNWVNIVDPDVTFVSSGPTSSNPKQVAIDSLNRPNAMRWVYLTSDSKNPTWGGNPSDDHMVLKATANAYTISGPTIPTQTFLVDELSLPPALPGDVALAEFFPQPGVVVDQEGEYIEITNLTQRLLPMRGWTLRDAGGDSVTIASNALLAPRGTILVAVQGDVDRNGGIDPGAVWPRDAFVLDNGTDEIIIEDGPETLIDLTLPSNNFTGRSWERLDLYDPGTTGNFTLGAETFGDGDLGTPGSRNTSDTTPWVPIFQQTSPEHGPVDGGNVVTLTGFDLAEGGVPTVTFGLLPSPDVMVVDDKTLIAEVPQITGKPKLIGYLLKIGAAKADVYGQSLEVDVSVTTVNGASTQQLAYRYVSPVESGPQLAK